ncbi:MAG: hypothetical protein Q9190_005592 [Brigantiaea leucoxantha]
MSTTPTTHHHLNGRKLRNLLRPNGRRVHIANTPEEHSRLRQSLAGIEPDDNFDIYLHGSPEHIDAVREIHDHHEQKRTELREKHGNLYEEFESIHLQLDTLAAELNRVNQHNVLLDANFSKFGYDAHLKYLHKGLIWRSSELEEVQSFELFVDLLYVGIIGIVGDNASENPTNFGLLKFIVTFTIGWKMWSDFTFTISWLDADDIFRRLAVILVAAISCALWIGSIHVDYPNRLAIVWIALVLDIFGHGVVIIISRRGQALHPRYQKHIGRWFEFFPAINIEHKTERTNAFVTLVFGYSVLALLYQNRATYGINAFFGKAVLGLIQAFCFNWIYFEIDGWNVHTHAIRRHIASSMIWNTFHLPFIMSYVLAGACLSKLVLAHDCRDTNRETLTETYADRSEEEIAQGLRWFYSAGLGIALACMCVISMSHVHKEFEGQRLSKNVRLIVRIAVAIVLICLPLAESLSSLQLVSTTTGLVALVLTIELYGSTSVGESFWRDGRRCKYWTDCPIKRSRALQEALKSGGEVKVEDLGLGDLQRKEYMAAAA